MKALMIRNFAMIGMAATMIGTSAMATAADWRGGDHEKVVVRGHDDSVAIGVGVGLLIGAAILSNQHHHCEPAPRREVVVYDRGWRDRDFHRDVVIRREREIRRDRDDRRWR